MYDPSTFSLAESSFAFFYNGSSQGPITGNTRVAITDSAHSTAWSTTGSPNHTLRPIGSNHFVGRSDAIMTPNAGSQYDTFGFLQAQGNISRSYTNVFSAWQDHPARTTYHTTLTDEALHLYCDDTASLLFTQTTATTNFVIDIGRAVIGGFLV